MGDPSCFTSLLRQMWTDLDGPSGESFRYHLATGTINQIAVVHPQRHAEGLHAATGLQRAGDLPLSEAHLTHQWMTAMFSAASQSCLTHRCVWSLVEYLLRCQVMLLLRRQGRTLKVTCSKKGRRVPIRNSPPCLKPNFFLVCTDFSFSLKRKTGKVPRAPSPISSTCFHQTPRPGPSEVVSRWPGPFPSDLAEDLSSRQDKSSGQKG